MSKALFQMGIPMVISMLVTTLYNVVDTYFVSGLGKQAAAATLASQIVTSAIYVWFFAGGRSFLKIAISKCRPSAAVYREILKVGVSMLLLQLLSSLSMSRISAAAGPCGEDAIAAMGIVLRIVTLGVNVVFGYMKGFQPMAGFNYGAKNIVRLREAIRSYLKWTTIFCVLWTGVIFLLAGPILSLFGDDPQVLAIAVPALRANTALFFTFGFQFTYSTLYLAMGKALGGGFLNICRQGVLFMPVILILPGIWGLDGVIWAQAVADILTTLVTVLFAVHIHKELRKAAG